MPLPDRVKNEIESFDARMSAPLQLNSSRAPASEGAFTVVIGAGGAGVDALLETKGMINQTCCLSETQRDQPTDRVVYLAFDTDWTVEYKSSTRSTGGARLEEGELFRLTATDMGQTLSPSYRDQVPSYIRSWLDFNIGVHSGHDGTGGVRQCGRLLLFKNINGIIGAIRKAMERITADHTALIRNVYILTGLGGGTGSGIFLDLAYIVREVVAHLTGATGIHFFGDLFLPDVYDNSYMPEEIQRLKQKNGYAALKELDYLMNLPATGGRFCQQYSDFFSVDTQKPPFDFVNLIGGQAPHQLHVKDLYRNCMETVARSICMQVVNGPMPDLPDFAQRSRNPYQERAGIYASLGNCTYEVPAAEIQLYATGLLFEKMDPMFTCEPTQEEVNQARVFLGLTPGTLIRALTGEECSLALEGMPKWEDLFGRNPKYDYRKRCQRWIGNIEAHIHQQAERFVKDFPEKFDSYCSTWFTDGARGPLWVHRLLANDKETCSGLVACLQKDIQTTGQRMVNLRHKKEQMEEAIVACTNKAAHTSFLGNRKGVVQEYIDLLNAYSNLCAELVACQVLISDDTSHGIFPSCLAVMTEQDDSLYNVAAEVLVALKQVCGNNRDILTKAEMNRTGPGFTWEPLHVSDVGSIVRRAFEASDAAQETISKFSRELLSEARNWAKDGVHVRSFLRRYLDDNLSSVVNYSLENCLQEVLGENDPEQSVQQYLVPRLEQMSAPQFLSKYEGCGTTFTLIIVPRNCLQIVGAMEDYFAAHPAGYPMVLIGRSNREILAQTWVTGLPLSAYEPLAEWEKAYLPSMYTEGIHLYMNKNGEEDAPDWDDLPSPIPARSRPDQPDAYPEAIRRAEDEQRQLYRKCRELPIILLDISNTGRNYILRIAELPDLDKDYAVEQMKDQNGRPDARKLEDAIQQLTTWKTKGLPVRGGCGADILRTYLTVATVPMDEQDPETVAQECFLGEYDRMGRARKELQKYEALARKCRELEQLAGQ